MPLLNMEVLRRHPECYREGGAVPSATWAISYMPGGHFLEVSANRGPDSGICLTRVAARRRGRGGEGGGAAGFRPRGAGRGNAPAPAPARPRVGHGRSKERMGLRAVHRVAFTARGPGCFLFPGLAGLPSPVSDR